MAPAPATHTYSTAGTVSSPLDLDKVRGEHEAVNVNGGGRKISPKPKVTLTSLTVNNVSVPRAQRALYFPMALYGFLERRK